MRLRRLLRPWCFFFGHRRGRRVAVPQTPETLGLARFVCLRCLSTWERKVK